MLGVICLAIGCKEIVSVLLTYLRQNTCVECKCTCDAQELCMQITKCDRSHSIRDVP